MAILLAGLLALFFALDAQAGTARWAGRFGAAAAVATLALYGVVLAVDGVALKQAVNAWASAPDAEKAARFASAEAIRWLEWGMRSYQNFALGLAVLLFAVAVVRTAWVPRPIAYLMGLSGLTYLVQGWVAGSEGFSQTQTIAIVLAWVLNVAWMIWLVVVAWRMQDSEPRRLADERSLGDGTWQPPPHWQRRSGLRVCGPRCSSWTWKTPLSGRPYVGLHRDHAQPPRP